MPDLTFPAPNNDDTFLMLTTLNPTDNPTRVDQNNSKPSETVLLPAHEDDSESQQPTPEITHTPSPETHPQRSTRTHTQPQRYGFVVCETAADKNDNPSYEQAMSGPDKQLWLRAMEEEFESFQHHNVGMLVQQPENANILGGMWVFSRPRDVHHCILKYKARWVLFGNHQIYGHDYLDTYASVGRADSWRILLAMGIRHGCYIIQFNIKTAFLNGDMLDLVYCRQVRGFRNHLHPGRVWLLNRSLYGSKQGARRWQQHFEKTIASFGLLPTNSDQAVYVLKNSEGILIIHLHVDDSDVFCSFQALLHRFRAFLDKAYTVKWTEDPSLYLGIHMTYDRTAGTVRISQRHYIESMLDTIAMTNCNPSKIPLPSTIPMTTGSDCEMDQAKDLPYQQLIGCLQWIGGSTRPDSSHAVSQLSAFNSGWTTTHWTAAKHVLCYLKGTIDNAIVYSSGTSEDLNVWSDDDFSRCPETRQSISGCLSRLHGGMISWRSQKQQVVVLSTSEAEYISAAEACKHRMWMKDFLFDIFHPVTTPIPLHLDSTSAILTVTEDSIKRKSKHIYRRYHFIQHLYLHQDLRLFGYQLKIC